MVAVFFSRTRSSDQGISKKSLNLISNTTATWVIFNAIMFSTERINEHYSQYNSKALGVDDIKSTGCMVVCAEEPKNFKNTALTGQLKYGVYFIDVGKCRKGRYMPIHKNFIRDMDFGCGFLLTGAK